MAYDMAISPECAPPMIDSPGPGVVRTAMRNLLILVLLAMVSGAWAQVPPRPPVADPLQARAALETLKDERKRSELIRVLEGIAAAQPAATAAAPPAPPPADTAAKPAEKPALVVPLAPDSLGAQLIAGASDNLQRISNTLIDVLGSVANLSLLWFWLVDMVTNPSLYSLLLDASWRVALVVVAALLVEAAVARMMRRPMHALALRVPAVPDPPAEVTGIAEAELGQTEKLPRRVGLLRAAKMLPFAIAGLLLDLVPVLCLLAAGYAGLGSGLADGFAPRFVLLGVLHAITLHRLVMAISRCALAARVPELSLFTLPRSTAASVLGWISRVAGLAIYGTTFAETAVLYGMYALVHDRFLNVLGLVVTLMVCAALLRHRAGIAGLIRAVPAGGPVAASIRDRVADAWHIVACLYLLSLWLVWALQLPDGFNRLLRVMLSTAIVLALARLAGYALAGFLRRLLSEDAETPGRLQAYHALAHRAGRIAVALATAICLLQAWGVPAFEWFATDRLGGRLIGAVATLAVTLVIALVTWEAANMAIQRHLDRLAAEHQAARSARLRTLLPVLRTTLLVAICLVTGLMALSEIGVNIAPLLAGAGVVGLAIGFGSQKLVQDIITGLFLLLENAMQVGDSVTLGGLSGTVENLSIRTIRLRALDGSVHIVPFSAVTTVTNMTRDFGYAVIDVRVGLNEPPDRIADLLREVAAEMRNDPAWATMMTGDLDVMGVDSFNVQSYTIRGRIRTTPSSRWAVGREMNRRIKNRFDAQAIESPMTSYRALGLPTPGEAAPPPT